MDEAHIPNALDKVWQIISRANKYIDETMPWVLYKEERTKGLESVMYHLVEVLRKVAILLKPAMEDTVQKMFNQLGISKQELMVWDSLKTNPEFNGGFKVIEKGEPLFTRLEVEEEVNYLKEKMKK